ncbi:ParA family protein [Halobacteriovorax sp. CON-3]|uniref:ParA family protein n=1 Tax=Halobacteriovorax sp. CON-3 TaxID=3157710 RepID=UPI00371FCC01
MFRDPTKEKEVSVSKFNLAVGEERGDSPQSTTVAYKDARKSRKKKNKVAIHIYVGSNKGGVGKSTIAYNLAWFLNARGKRVLLCDFDAQANISCSILKNENEIEAKYSLYDILEGNVEISEVIGKVCEDLDVMGGNSKLSEIDYFLRSKEREENENKSFFDSNDQESDASQIYRDTYELFKQMSVGYDFVIYDTNPENNKFNRLSMQVADLMIIPVQAKQSSAKAFKLTGSEFNDCFLTIDRDNSDITERIKVLYNIISPVRFNIPKEANEEEVRAIFEKEEARERELEEVVRGMYGEHMFKEVISHSGPLAEASDVGWPLFLHSEADEFNIKEFSNFTDEVIEVCDSLEKGVKKENKGRFAFLSPRA